MATFTTIKNRGGGRGALAGVLQYIRQDEKTLWEGHRLVSGWNCTAPTAWQEIQLTKERFVKTDGWQYYHFVQFFAATDGLTPQEAHAIGLELAQRKFPDFEVLVATHIDTDILYSHLIVNSVSFQNGRPPSVDPSTSAEAGPAEVDGHPGVSLCRQGRELEIPTHECHRPMYAVRIYQGRLHLPDGERGVSSSMVGHSEVHYLHHTPGHEVPGRPAPRIEIHERDHGT